MDPHHDIREQLTDYALGELPAATRERVVAHLAVCPACASEARELTATLHSIALAETAVELPAHLKGRVLAALAIESTPKSRRIVVPMAARPPAGRPHAAWLALAATAVLILGGMLVLSQQRAARLSDEIRRVDEDTARLASEAATVAGQADLVVGILTAADMRRIDLQGFDTSRDATARAFWSAAKGLLIVADRLPAPPVGRTYQVWLIGAGGPVSAGLIDGRAGRGMLIVRPPAGAPAGSVTVAVTDEPAGGLPTPSGSKHLAGSL